MRVATLHFHRGPTGASGEPEGSRQFSAGGPAGALGGAERIHETTMSRFCRCNGGAEREFEGCVMRDAHFARLQEGCRCDGWRI